MRDQVTRDADDVGASLRHPGDGFRRRTVPARQRRTEMEVREVRYPKTVERGRKAGDLHVEHSGAEPAGFEPSVDDARAGETPED